ncbi:hypothetical protein BaRGS_00031610 [Batillaria attramentaria]|uniref:Uncharacterized protein n=1 Tax=Batillaria attramentaria TaxID=370345 RepID=A0ABD0JQ59_9CAEN
MQHFLGDVIVNRQPRWPSGAQHGMGLVNRHILHHMAGHVRLFLSLCCDRKVVASQGTTRSGQRLHNTSIQQIKPVAQESVHVKHVLRCHSISESG